MNKKIYVLGGGTFSHVRSHLALATPAFGTTAKKIARLCRQRFLIPTKSDDRSWEIEKPSMDVELVLTQMADPEGTIAGQNEILTTVDDVSRYVDLLVSKNTTKVIFFTVGMCDFDGEADQETEDGRRVEWENSGKYAKRLRSSQSALVQLNPAEKVIRKIRKNRKDIFLVGFKTTCGASKEEQFQKGLNLLKTASCNLVVVNDVKTRQNAIITPEEAVYGEDLDRDSLLEELVDMVYWRTHLSFTRSTVVDGKPVAWAEVKDKFPALTKVVEYCIEKGAYKPFNGATVGHFAAKLAPNHFLTSIRKTNFNDIEKTGMVEVKTDQPDTVIAYGARPSVGGQSQREIFGKYEQLDSIVHAHVPLKKDHKDDIPVVSQREFECGSRECASNASNGLKQFKNLYCVMLDKHGPNIVFNSKIDPHEVINFIEGNFDLQGTTAGFKEVILFDGKFSKNPSRKISRTVEDAQKYL